MLYLDGGDGIFVGHGAGNAGRVGGAGEQGLLVQVLHGEGQHGRVPCKQPWGNSREQPAGPPLSQQTLQLKENHSSCVDCKHKTCVHCSPGM